MSYPKPYQKKYITLGEYIYELFQKGKQDTDELENLIKLYGAPKIEEILEKERARREVKIP